MNTQTKITAFAFLLALFGISYGLVCNSNAKAGTEYFELEQKNIQLEHEIGELKQQRWDYEEMKKECIDSYTEQQDKVSKQADKKRIEQGNNTVKQMGLIQSSQAQKKNKLLNNSETSDLNVSGYTMNDTADETTDKIWYKRLLKWVGWN